MRTRFMTAITMLAIAIGFSAPGQAVSTLRIGTQVLTAGDSEVRVTELLGKPTHTSRGNRSRRSGPRRSSRSRSRRVVVLDKDARGEKWQYKRGDHVTTVTIVDGKVSDIDDHRL